MKSQTERTNPNCIEITRLAIAAGAAGHTMLIGFRDFPASAIGLIWAEFCKKFNDGQVLQVSGRKELHGLNDRINSLRLILVRDPDLLGAVAWELTVRPKTDNTAAKPAPTVLFQCDGRGPVEQPGPTLVLAGYHQEIAAVEDWYWNRVEDEQQECEFGQKLLNVRLPHRLRDMILGSQSEAAPYDRRLQEILVVEALLAGACLLRSATLPLGTSGFEADFADYKRVYHLLHSLVGKTSEEPTDPLVSAMVYRANAYMRAIHERQNSKRSGRRNDEQAADDVAPITRPELADLGNPRSKSVRLVIEHLGGHQQELRRKWLGRIGLIRGLSADWQWPDVDTVDQLRPLLLTWSPKQIITRFHPLHEQGLISAKRSPANGPWTYRLPAAFVPVRRPFSYLPHPDVDHSDLPADQEVDATD